MQNSGQLRCFYQELRTFEFRGNTAVRVCQALLMNKINACVRI